MNTHHKTQQQIDMKPAIGKILISKPFEKEEIYKRCVILLIDIGEDGVTGIILNKPSNLNVEDAFPQLREESTAEEPLYYGGPINKKVISFIHRVPEIPGHYKLNELGLFWGGDWNYIEAKILDQSLFLYELTFFAGFVQWFPGDLEKELDELRWFMQDATIEDAFLTLPEELWGKKLSDMGNYYGGLHKMDDPSLN